MNMRALTVYTVRHLRQLGRYECVRWFKWKMAMLPWGSSQNGLKATDLEETGLVIPKYTSHEEST